MFCPNCAAQINLPQKFCRGCGLRLDRIAEEIAIQLPTTTAHTDLLRRAHRTEVAGLGALAVFGLMILAFILFGAAGGNFGKLEEYAALLVGVMISAGLLSVFLFAYAHHLREKLSHPHGRETPLELPPPPTSLRLEAKEFTSAQAATNVTERTTDLLSVERAKTTDELG